MPVTISGYRVSSLKLPMVSMTQDDQELYKKCLPCDRPLRI